MLRALVILLLSSLVAQSPSTIPTEKAIVDGIVRTVGTGLPLDGVDVLASGQSDGRSVSVSVKSSREGRFSLALDPGVYRFSAIRTGFVTLAYGQRGEGNFGVLVTVTAGQRLSDIDFQLAPTGTILGRIYDPDGKPMEGIAVSIVRRSWAADGRLALSPPANIMTRSAFTTNDLGEYRAYWLPPGEYYVTARPPTPNGGQGFQPPNAPPQTLATTYFPGLIDPNQATKITVPPGTEVRGVDFSLSRVKAVTVSGRLNTGATDPFSVTQVNMIPIDNSFLEHGPVAVNESGKTFVVRNVMPGRYRMVASLRIPNRENLAGEAFVEVGESSIDGVNITLTAGQELRGKITFEDSPAAVQAALEAKRFHVALRGELVMPFIDTEAQVQPDGNFTIPGVADILYHLSVFGLSEDFYISSARMGGIDLLDRGLKPGRDSIGPIEISVSGLGGRIEGVLRDDQGKGIMSGRVVLVPDPGPRSRHDLFRTATTDINGRFSLRAITPGAYKLFSWDDVPNLAYFDPDFLRTYEDKARPVRVDKNDFIQMDVQLAKQAGLASKK